MSSPADSPEDDAPLPEAPQAPAAGGPAADGGRRAATVLHRVFGFETFRGRQEEVISHVVGGGDALVLMATGGGKSLCYQLPALADDVGLVVVVSPLIALMSDQLRRLQDAGVAAAMLARARAVRRVVDGRRGNRGVRRCVAGMGRGP